MAASLVVHVPQRLCLTGDLLTGTLEDDDDDDGGDDDDNDDGPQGLINDADKWHW